MKNLITQFTHKSFLLIFIFLCILSSTLNAQSDSKGKDFWLMFNTNASSPTLTMFITSDVNTTGTISGASFSTISFSVTANTVTSVSMPVALHSHTNDVVDNKGIHVQAANDVTVYGLNRAPATTDAYLGLPTDVLGTDYMILTYKNTDVINAVQFGVVATTNSTTVTIIPSVTTGSRTAGTAYTITMNQGETYQLTNTAAKPADLTGTTITSDQPIGVFGSHQCANIPAGFTFCDHICEMLPPTTTFGTHFGTVPLSSRVNGDTWRFMASQDNTVVTINGTPQAAINKGKFVETVLTSQAFVTSDKPILAAQFANGSSFSGNPGDPFIMLIPPLEQFLAGYTLTTVSGFATHYVNLVVPNSITSSVIMDGSALSSSLFTPIGSSGYSGAQISVANGSHTFTAPLPFGAFQYGFNTNDSYGYPGGQSFSPVATVSMLDLTPATGSSVINVNKCWDATVTDQNSSPVVGVKVDFDITGPNSASTGFAITDGSGVAHFCYTGTVAGNDAIDASVGNITDNSTFTWTCTPPTFTTCPSNSAVNSSIPTPASYSSTASGSPSPVFTFKLSGATSGTGGGTGSGNTFNLGVTAVTVYATNGCGMDSCKFNLTVANQGCGAGNPVGVNAITGDITLSSQTQVNNFYSTVAGVNNGNKWTKVIGSLTVDGSNSGDPITDLCNLNALTEVTKSLIIRNFSRSGNPTDLNDLAALSIVGCNLSVNSNPMFKTIALDAVSSVGCALTIKDNVAVELISMSLISTMKGDQLVVKNNPKAETITFSNRASSFNFTGKGSSVDVSNNGNTSSNALSMDFNKIAVVKGAVVFSNNDNSGVSNFDNIFGGLTNISTVWGSLTITNNDYLAKCCIAASVVVSSNTRTISGNTGNCANSAAVVADCGAFHKRTSNSITELKEKGDISFNVYPSPNKGKFGLDIICSETGTLKVSILDLMGREVYNQSFSINGTTNIPVNMEFAAEGQYLVKANINGQLFVKRVMLVK